MSWLGKYATRERTHKGMFGKDEGVLNIRRLQQELGRLPTKEFLLDTTCALLRDLSVKGEEQFEAAVEAWKANGV